MRAVLRPTASSTGGRIALSLAATFVHPRSSQALLLELGEHQGAAMETKAEGEFNIAHMAERLKGARPTIAS
jgi:hypothetical protein